MGNFLVLLDVWFGWFNPEASFTFCITCGCVGRAEGVTHFRVLTHILSWWLEANTATQKATEVF